MIKGQTEGDVGIPDPELKLPEGDLAESKRAQLSLLQSRITVHASKLWQLPLTFLGLLALGVSGLPEQYSGLHAKVVFSAISIFGGILLWCMYGAFEGYGRAVMHMIKLEEELGLTVSTALKPAHTLPYFALVVVGIILSAIAALFT